MGLFVKICGIAREEDARAVAAMKPDAMGFIFYPKSPRCVDPGEAARWIRSVPSGITRVGVFVDAPADRVRAIVSQCGLDVVQLHGSEDQVYMSELGLSCWKAVRLDREAAGEASLYPVDALLVDHYTEKMPGGTGQTVDWGKAADFIRKASLPVLLAGGLHPANVAEAIRRTQPWGVDVSSGVEARPGCKDLDKVREFIDQCRKC